MTTNKLSPWAVFFILFYITLTQVSLDLYLPSMPEMVHVFGTSMSNIQLSIATYLVGIGIAQFVYGPLSDSYGRRPIVLTGSVIYLFGCLICVFSSHINFLLFGRIVQGMGIGFAPIMGRAIMRDLLSDKKKIARMVSYQAICWSTVPLVAPVIGGYIERWFNWRANFIVLLGISVFVLLASWWKLKESKDFSQRHPFSLTRIFKNYWMLVKRFRLVGYMLVLGCQYGSVMTILQLSPFILQNDLGYRPDQYGWLILVVGLGSMIGSFVNSYLSQKFEIRKIIFVSLILALIFLVGQNLFSIHWYNAWVILVPLFLMRLTGGITYSGCVTEGMAQLPEHTGSISALYGIVITLGGAFFSFIVAHLPQYHQWTLTSSVLGEYILAFIIFLLIGVALRRS